LFLHLPCQESLICCAKRYGIFVKAKGYGRTLKDWRTKNEKTHVYVFKSRFLVCPKTSGFNAQWSNSVFSLQMYLRVHITTVSSNSNVPFRIGLGMRLRTSEPSWRTPWLCAPAANHPARLRSACWRRCCICSWPNQVGLHYSAQATHTHIYIHIFRFIYLM